MTNKTTRGLVALIAVVAALLVARLIARLQEMERRVERLETLAAARQANDSLLATPHRQEQAKGGRLATPRRSERANGGRLATPRKQERANGGHSDTAGNLERPNGRQMESRQPTESSTGRKFTVPVRLDLNSVDSATLVRVPGIGSSTAAAILRYRTELGGFYDARQIAEKLTWDSAREWMDAWCEVWFFADASHVQKLHINRLSFRELMRHPYLNYEQVRQMVAFRDRHGRIANIGVLEQMDAFADADIARLQHYIDFD